MKNEDAFNESLDLTYFENFLDMDYETSVFCSCPSTYEKDFQSLTFCPICGKLLLKS